MTNLDPPRQRQPIFNVPTVILIIIGAMSLIHFYREFWAGEAQKISIILEYAFIGQKYAESVHIGYSYYSLFWSPITYAFLHGDFLHLGINCLWLLAFGGVVALRIGWFKFILLFCFGAIGGALLFYFTHSGATAIMVGASGSVSALMGAAARFAFPSDGGFSRNTYALPRLSLLNTFRNKSAASFLTVFVLINLVLGAGSLLSIQSASLVAWQAHIGGLAVGLFMFQLFDRR